MLDELAEYNSSRWSDLVRAGVPYSRPWLDLDKEKARAAVDPRGIIGELEGKDVLCLAGGGGQQSAAFSLLGARVTVLDFCEEQLKHDVEAGCHYGVEVKTVLGDMRDLSCFEDRSFDVVWHAHSLNFVPDAQRVFSEVARVLRPDGIYRLECWNPLAQGLQEAKWNGEGYLLTQPFIDGTEIILDDPYWDIAGPDGIKLRVKGPREFRHSLGAILNGLISRGLVLLSVWEEIVETPEALPGSFLHLQTFAPSWLNVYAALRPDFPAHRCRWNESLPHGSRKTI